MPKAETVPAEPAPAAPIPASPVQPTPAAPIPAITPFRTPLNILYDFAAQLFGKSCFAAGTPLLIPGGSKLIEHFVPGDYVFSRDEFEPDSAVLPKIVEEIFKRVGRILTLKIGKQRIRTTTEHPFWVFGKGWLPASQLIPGDRLISHNGEKVVVSEIVDSGLWETVYNMRIADFHTYFVGCEEWGFSVWAHNAPCVTALDAVADANLIKQGYTHKVTVNGTTTYVKLPAYVEGGPTSGVLITNEGHVVPLESGGATPHPNYVSGNHVEGHAAQYIENTGSTGGTLIHNNPNGVCGWCNSMVPTLLPEGTSLQVISPPNTVTPNGWFNQGLRITDRLDLKQAKVSLSFYEI